MKISKVNHTKSAVGIDDKQPKGILYENPKHEPENAINLEKYVVELNKDVQRLYSIFSTANINMQKKAYKRKQYCDVDRFLRELKFQVLKKYRSDFSMEKNISYQMQKLEQWMGKCTTCGNDLDKFKTFKDIKSSDIDYVVDACLRNSLRKYVNLTGSEQKVYFPELVKKLLKVVIRTELTRAEQLSSEEKKTLLRVLNEDYGKSEELRRIVNSIESQNVRVSGVEKDGKVLLQLANAGHKKKQYVFLFLKKFASARDEKEREEMLLHFKHLVLLFYCGKSRYEEAIETIMPVWSWGTLADDEAANFDDVCYEMINEKASLVDKNEKRKIGEVIERVLREKIANCYREAVKLEEMTEEDKYWLQYIENSAEKLLLGKKNVNPIRLSISYLCEHTYREWTSYICMKYIDIGKGVYHFTAPKDLKRVITGDAVIGEVLPQYREGITSFDYERIKAEEALNRDLSLYIAFAVNTFAMSVMGHEGREKSNNEDILLVNVDEEAKKGLIYPDVDRRLLRFFGGKSSWAQGGLEKFSKREIVQALKEALKSIRNSNFHYTAEMSELSDTCNSVLNTFFQKEFAEAGKFYRKKYFSNNLWMFYAQEDIITLMDALYCKEPERPAQIPAFGKIINKANMDEIITAFIYGKKKKKLLSDINSVEYMEKFRASLFFVLKEIYYYGFLQDSNVKKYFLDAVAAEQEELSKYTDNERKAYDDFKKYLAAVEKNNRDITFGEICQQIMTAYNQQNQGRQRVVSNLEGHDKEKYKHFRMLLYKYIRKAFVSYLKSEEFECYSFLRAPEKRETVASDITLEAFCPEWCPHLYDNLKKDIEHENTLLGWYVAAHFLTPKQLNMMIGCIKNYIQYIQDIEHRCKDTANRVEVDTEYKVAEYKQILRVLEFSMLFCGSVTNCFEDYFDNEEDYTKHLANYIDFERKGEKNYNALKVFCNQPVKEGSPTGTIGLYYDEQNPIVNRNVVYAGMYGNEKLFRNCYQKVSEQDIKEYYRKRIELAEVLKNGKCKDLKEEKELREFQNRKNHIELTEITTYTEIINDFIGQLISWAYLRERDLMYYQLGFQYIRLFYTDCVEKESVLRRLEGKDIHIQDGAILYQIIAMYTYNLPVLILDEGENAVRKKEASSNGESVVMFYKNYCRDKGEIYELGLSLFENVKSEHDEIVQFRNYIDHFKYFSCMDRSIMDFYSDVYDRFFTYDVKLRKSVSFIFNNILLRYFVIADTEMQRGDSCRYKGNTVKKNAARLFLKELKSDVFHLSRETSKQNGGRRNKSDNVIDARGSVFLEQLKRILEYKDLS